MAGFFQAIGRFFTDVWRFVTALELFSNAYFQFSIVIVAALVAAVILQRIVKSRNFKKIKNKTIKNLLEKLITKNILIIGILIGILLAVNGLELEESAHNNIRNFLVTLIVFFTYFTGKNVMQSVFNTVETSRSFKKSAVVKNRNLLTIIRRAAQITLFLIFTTVILGLWGIQIGPILTGLGIAGVAVGLALQDSLANVFGGISLILDDAYQVDDYIELESGVKGTVHSVGYRSTKIKTFNDEIIIVPNGQLSQLNIKNLSRPALDYRLSLEVGVAYGSEIDHVKMVIKEVIEAEAAVLDFPEPSVYLSEMGDFAIKFKVYCTIQTPLNKMNVTDLILSAIYKSFKEHDIAIPFPTRTVHLIQSGEDQ